MRSFRNIFFITFLLSLIVLVGIERMINESIETSHVLGWACVSLAIAALVGILGKKENVSH